MAKNFLWGMVQLVIWPLFRPSRWRTATAKLGVAPGLGLLDLSLRRSDHRRLLGQTWCLWLLALTVNAVTGIMGFGVEELNTLPLGFLAILAIAENLPGAIALLALWQLLRPLILLSMYKVLRTGPISMTFIVSVACLTVFGFAGLRYGRNARIRRHLLSLLVAPFLMVAAMIPAMVIAGAVGHVAFTLLDSAVRLRLSDILGLTNILPQCWNLVVMLMGSFFAYPMILVLLVLPVIRDALARTWEPTHPTGGPTAPPTGAAP